MLVACAVAVAMTATASPALLAQAAPAAGTTKLLSPVRGEAEVGYTKPAVQRKGGTIVTTFKVKNLATAPIAGFKVDEFWYDKAGETVAGSPTFRWRKPLMPGEVIEVTLTVPVNPKMDRNSYKFEHANGKIKPTLVAKM
jgi:hypothetical protein